MNPTRSPGKSGISMMCGKSGNWKDNFSEVTETQMIRDGIIKWGMLQLDDSPKIFCICCFNGDIMGCIKHEQWDEKRENSTRYYNIINCQLLQLV